MRQGHFVIVLALTTSVAAYAQTPAKSSAAKPPAHPAAHTAAATMLNVTDLKWGPAPDALPAGAQAAVVDGDPSKAGLFVVRVKFPDGYKVMPHWHPTDEGVTVLSGTLKAG